MCAVLRGTDGAALGGARAVFPHVTDRVFRMNLLFHKHTSMQAPRSEAPAVSS